MEKNVEESTVITIEDKDSKENKKIKDINFSLNTGQSGNVNYETEIINGSLETVILSCDNRISIDIFIGDIIIFSVKDISGVNFLPLRASAIWIDGVNFRDAPVKWVLNNSIKCAVKGPKNTNANFTIRYS
jgi:hypothetical protein